MPYLSSPMPSAKRATGPAAPPSRSVMRAGTPPKGRPDRRQARPSNMPMMRGLRSRLRSSAFAVPTTLTGALSTPSARSANSIRKVAVPTMIGRWMAMTRNRMSSPACP